VSTPTKSVDRGGLLSSVSAAETTTAALMSAVATRRVVSEIPRRLTASPASSAAAARAGSVKYASLRDLTAILEGQREDLAGGDQHHSEVERGRRDLQDRHY